MRRLAHSWTLWRQRRATARILRQQVKARLTLEPLLLEALTPVAEAMRRLDQRQQETRQLLQTMLAEHQQRESQETRELLLEILNSLQPPPELEISRAIGLSAPPS